MPAHWPFLSFRVPINFHFDQGFPLRPPNLCSSRPRGSTTRIPGLSLAASKAGRNELEGKKALSPPQSIEVFCTRPSPDISKRIHSLCTPSPAAGISPWLSPLQQPERSPRGLRTRVPGRVNRELTSFRLPSGSLVGPSRATILTAKHAPQNCLQPGEARRLPI